MRHTSNSRQSSSKPKTQFSKWTVAETPFARASRQVSEEDGRQEPSMWPRSHSPLGEIVSKNLEPIAANIVFIPDPKFAALKLRGAEFGEWYAWPRRHLTIVMYVHDVYGLTTWNWCVVLINQIFTWISFNNKTRQRRRTDMALAAMNGVEFISVREVSLLSWRREESQVNKPINQGFNI